MRGLADDLREAAHAWAEQTAQAQGLPAQVEQVDVLRDIAQLLGLRGDSGAPDRVQPGRVEAVEAAPAGSNDDMIEQGGDDLLLPG